MQCFINVDQVRISYLEHNPQGVQTIFFIHGNSASARIWMSQLNSPLLTNYRLIAFDLPAHGQSDVTNEYSMISLGKIITQAVNQLHEGNPYMLVGLSVGSNVVAEMLLQGARPVAVVIIGSCIVGGAITVPAILYKAANLEAGFSDEPTDETLMEYLRGGVYFQKQEVLEELASDFRKVKDQFRTRLGQAVANGQYSNEVEALRTCGVPVLVIFGMEEKVIDIDYMDRLGLPVQIVKIPEAGHFTNIDQPEQVNSWLNNMITYGKLDQLRHISST